MNTPIASNFSLFSHDTIHKFSLDGLQDSNLLTVVQTAQHQLQQFFASPRALEQLQEVFEVTHFDGAQALIANGALGEFVLPQVQVLNDDLLNGARGGYSSDRHQIYLAQSLLESDSLSGSVGVLIEEIGHHIDTLLNPGGDTPGDEGELFKKVVFGESISETELARIRAENDFGMMVLGGEAIAIEQDNSLAEAQNLGTLVGTRTFNDFVGSADTNDYYQFNVSDTSDFNLSLNGLSSDADVELLDSSGELIQSSINSGSDAESITRQLNAGTYYVRVYPYSGDTNYTLSLAANRLDRAGNSLAAARNVGVLRGSVSFQDFVGSVDTNDYYRFSVGNTGTFRLTLNGLAADADVELLNSSGGVIQSSTASGSTPESITRALSAGVYYVRVYPYDNSDTNYNLSLTATPPDRAGNRLGVARNIGILRSNRTFQDFVGSTDTNDYYRFSVSNTSNFRLALSGLSADADVQLLNGNGGVIQSSTAGGSVSESINRTLRRGIYYVRVYPFSGDTNYNLSLSATPVITTPDAAGNTLGTARNVGTLSGNRTFRDFVGSNDTNDYYRVALARNSNFSLTLNGLSSDADVQLLDRNGGLIQSSTAGGSNPETIRSALNAGVYYVRVYPYSGDTNYSLSLSAVAAPIDRAGNSLAAARNLGVLSGSRSFQDFVGRIDTNDYYRFSLNQTSNFRLALNGLRSDADVQLLDSTGSVIQGSYAESSLPESINRTLNAGTYYVRVYPYSGNTNYNLILFAAAATQPDGAGNTLDSARNIGTLNSSRFFRDFVGSSDTNDYYRFNVTQNSSFRLVLNGLTADADVELLNSSGGLVQSSTEGGSDSELIEQQLNAGTYYVRVYPFNNSNTNYDLLLSATPATSVFNATYGYGLINAAAAVARAIGQAPFADVTNLGGNNWGNDMVNAPEVWARGYTGQGSVVAVLDTGVDYTHSDLNDNIWVNTREVPNNGIDDDRNGYIDDIRGWDFIGRDNNPMDEDNHGTHVAGTIAAENNGFGVTGVAYNARIMPVRVIGNVSVDQYHRALADGIRYAANNGADVINMSLRTLPIGGGTSGDIAIVREAIRYATNRGSIVVSAAGNFSESLPTFPARYATLNGLSVGALDINRNLASFSNRAGSDNAMQHIVAPGAGIYSTTPGNTYNFLSGTSMASPHVAGVVALMLSANRSLTHAQIREILTSSAVRLS